MSGMRHVSRAELAELAIVFGGAAVLTALGTMVSGWIGVPIGWRLAAGACGATVLVGSSRLAYDRRPPTLKWAAAVAALCVLILLTNAFASVRFW